jgi:hypothetical protein
MTSAHELLAVVCLRVKEMNYLVKCELSSSMFHCLDSSCRRCSKFTVLSVLFPVKQKISGNAVVVVHIIILTYMPT